MNIKELLPPDLRSALGCGDGLTKDEIARASTIILQGRNAKGWNQRQLSRESGLAPTTLANLQTQTQCSRASAWKFATALGVTAEMAALFSGTDSKIEIVDQGGTAWTLTRETI